MKTLKNGKKYAIKFDRKCKNAKRKCHQQIYYKLRNGGGGGGRYSVLVNNQSFLSNLFSLSPQLFFSINCIRNRFLRVSFIELFDFIIYQHLNRHGRAELSTEYCVSNTATRVRLRLQAACFDTYASGWRLEERELTSQSPSSLRSYSVR